MGAPKRAFNPRKALHALVYVTSRLPQPANVYNVLKCIWFADREHLEKYGRQIYGETYFAPEHGPVPSRAYDLIKYVSGRPNWPIDLPEAFEALTATSTEISSKVDPDLELFSRSELICLGNAAQKYGKLSFGKLKTISHKSKAFKRADFNGDIDFDALLSELTDGEAIKQHLEDRSPGHA